MSYTESDEGYAVVITEGPIEDTGTIVVFRGVTDEDETVTFGVDHRCAQDIVNQLGIGESEFESQSDEPVEVMVIVHVEPWQILSRHPSDEGQAEIVGSDVWVEGEQIIDVTPVTDTSFGGGIS